LASDKLDVMYPPEVCFAISSPVVSWVSLGDVASDAVGKEYQFCGSDCEGC